jgi:hypothetical protein
MEAWRQDKLTLKQAAAMLVDSGGCTPDQAWEMLAEKPDEK